MFPSQSWTERVLGCFLTCSGQKWARPVQTAPWFYAPVRWSRWSPLLIWERPAPANRWTGTAVRSWTGHPERQTQTLSLPQSFTAHDSRGWMSSSGRRLTAVPIRDLTLLLIDGLEKPWRMKTRATARTEKQAIEGKLRQNPAQLKPKRPEIFPHPYSQSPTDQTHLITV